MVVGLVVVLMLVLVTLGLWTGVALVIAGFVGLVLSFRDQATLQAGLALWNLANSSTLVAIPLFVLMGELLADSRSVADLYGVIARLGRRVPSAPGLGAVAVGAMVSSVSGSLAAVTAIMTRTSYARLRQAGLPARQTLGLVASVGALGIMIPPSLTLIIYGSLTETPISTLFRVAIVPGLVQAGLFLACVAWVWRRRAARRATGEERPATPTGFGSAAWQFPAAMTIVVGSFILGIVTPVEAAALGVAVALVMSGINREFSWTRLRLATRNTIVTTAMMLLIVLGAQMISAILAFQGFTRTVSLFVRELPVSSLVILGAIALLYVVLGTIFDGLSLMVLTLPFIFPAVVGLGRDPLWFGVLLVVCVQIAELSPPVGINLFVAQHLTGEPIEEVWSGTIPYLAVLVCVLAALIVYPPLGLQLR